METRNRNDVDQSSFPSTESFDASQQGHLNDLNRGGYIDSTQHDKQ